MGWMGDFQFHLLDSPLMNYALNTQLLSDVFFQFHLLDSKVPPNWCRLPKPPLNLSIPFIGFVLWLLL